MKKGYSAPSVIKAFTILGVLARSSSPLTLTEISERSGMNKSSCLGILRALEAVGVVRRDKKTKKYERTLSLFDYVSGLDSSYVLAEASKGILEDISRRCRDSVFLGHLEGGLITIVRVEEGKGDFVLTSSPGRRIPADAGAIGKALKSPERGRFYIDRGGEYMPGVSAVCTPIFFRDRVFGFLWIAGYGIDDAMLEDYGRLLADASLLIEKRLEGEQDG